MVRGFWRHRGGRSVRHGPRGAHDRDRRRTLRTVTSDPLLDPVPPTHDVAPTPSLRRNRRVRARLERGHGLRVRQLRDPDRAAVRGDPRPGAGPIEVAVLRSLELVAALIVGLVAGAWVDRLRRRPVLIWADIGRAALLGSIPLAALGGWLTLPQVFIVAAAAAVLTTFFDVADQRLPADDRAAIGPGPRERGPRGDELRGRVRGLRRRRLPGQPADRADRDPHRCRLVRRLGRPAGLDPHARAAAPARGGPGARPGRDPRGPAAGRPRPGPPRARRRDDGPGRDVGRLRGDLAAVRRR